MTPYRQFLEEEVPRLLPQLAADTQPHWGKMQPQHMIEHVSALFYLAYSQKVNACFTPADKLPKARAFLFNDDKHFRPHTAGPGLPKEPGPFRFADLDEAKDKLLDSMKKFFAFFDADPEREVMHPVFGPLNQEGWERFQHKHLSHHFRQFGLLPLLPGHESMI
ncbi:MAG: DUF1569 domain-containing protein [Bacteroidetes bacterium]|nr:MAG: DUF1569 domain-containing protein [Bacteroidota bacterium]